MVGWRAYSFCAVPLISFLLIFKQEIYQMAHKRHLFFMPPLIITERTSAMDDKRSENVYTEQMKDAQELISKASEALGEFKFRTASTLLKQATEQVDALWVDKTYW